MDRLKALLIGILLAVILLFIAPLIPARGEAAPKPLFPDYKAEEVYRIESPDGRFHLNREEFWTLTDNGGEVWPVEESALKRLLAYPGSLVKPVLWTANPDSVSTEPNGSLSVNPPEGEWRFFNRQGEIPARFRPTESGAGLVEGQAYGSTGNLPGSLLTDYLDRTPLNSRSPRQIVMIDLDHALSGAGADQYRYTLILGEDHWHFSDGGPEPDPDLLNQALRDLVSLEAVTLLNRQKADLDKVRFRLIIADNSNRQVQLEVGNSLELGGRNLWPVRVTGSPYLYLFDQKELKKIARSRESYLSVE